LIIITTSHKPSQRTRSFAKDLASVLPDAKVITRGKKTLRDLSIIGFGLKANHILVIGEKRGNPSLIRMFSIDYSSKYPTLLHKYSIILKGITLSRENPEAVKTYGAEKFRVNHKECNDNNCFRLADVFLELVYNNIDENNYDIEIKLVTYKNYTIVNFINTYNKICGPIIKVSRVKRVERTI